jgi:two-component system chemotaxis response regulator CheY
MAKTTILVVDDSPFASKQIKDLVEENGYEVIGYAKNGEEGIRMYEELHPDLVIMDIIMPGIDGLETAEILMKKDPKATILMLSSLCDSGTLEEVKAIGLKYLIPKPWEDDVLLATLEMLKKQSEAKESEGNRMQGSDSKIAE